jgi:hypothetical protein
VNAGKNPRFSKTAASSPSISIDTTETNSQATSWDLRISLKRPVCFAAISVDPMADEAKPTSADSFYGGMRSNFLG